MKVIDETGTSKIAALIRKSSRRINKHFKVTVSRHSPESLQLTGYLPKTRGWTVELGVPLLRGYKKDYVRFLAETKWKEVWIKVASAGGRSKIYVR